jgi:hypothetical protein
MTSALIDAPSSGAQRFVSREVELDADQVVIELSDGHGEKDREARKVERF